MFSDLGGFVQLRGEMLQAHGNAYYGAVVRAKPLDPQLPQCLLWSLTPQPWHQGGGSGNCSEFETGHACNDFFGVPPFEEGTDTQSMNYKVSGSDHPGG